MLIPGFNLATSNYRKTRRELLLASGVVVSLTVLLVGQVALWAAGRQERREIGERLARMEGEFRRHEEEARARQAGAPGEAMKKFEAKVAVYNQILEASAFSWTGLLVELERSVPPSVSLKEIQPELATGQVRLSGTARSFDDLSLFLRNLEQRSAFRDVFLVRQAEQKSPSGGQNASGGPEKLEFVVTLLYQGRGR